MNGFVHCTIFKCKILISDLWHRKCVFYYIFQKLFEMALFEALRDGFGASETLRFESCDGFLLFRTCLEVHIECYGFLFEGS